MAAAPATKQEFDVDLIGIEFGSSAIKLCCYERNDQNIKPSSNVGDNGVIKLLDYRRATVFTKIAFESIINEKMDEIFGTQPNPVPQKVGEKKTIYVTDFVSNGHYLKTHDFIKSTGALAKLEEQVISYIQNNLRLCRDGLKKYILESGILGLDVDFEFKEYQEFQNVTTETLQKALNFEGEFEIYSANTAIAKYNSLTSEEKKKFLELKKILFQYLLGVSQHKLKNQMVHFFLKKQKI